MTLVAPPPAPASTPRLAELFETGLDAPICLTWELTYACNLSCSHCLSASGRRDPPHPGLVLWLPNMFG